jgi:hypothetical protein
VFYIFGFCPSAPVPSVKFITFPIGRAIAFCDNRHSKKLSDKNEKKYLKPIGGYARLKMRFIARPAW